MATRTPAQISPPRIMSSNELSDMYDNLESASKEYLVVLSCAIMDLVDRNEVLDGLTKRRIKRLLNVQKVIFELLQGRV